jgi:hypothetical protein
MVCGVCYPLQALSLARGCHDPFILSYTALERVDARGRKYFRVDEVTRRDPFYETHLSRKTTSTGVAPST